MLGAGDYPITIAEMHNYTEDADEYFELDEHENLKVFLALHPESGHVIPDTGGVRVLEWPIKATKKAARIVYYFRDLNMPLYMLALYKSRERIPLEPVWRTKIKELVDQLVAQHREEWKSIILRQRAGGQESA
jgi:hypothetical protein